MTLRLLSCGALALVAATASGQPAGGEGLTIGDTFTIESEAVGETRRINVYAPAGYAESDTLRLPVLYMPDGGIGEDFLHIAGLVQISSLNGTMRPFLLVGIENTERRRDLTGPTDVVEDRTIAPRVGGSAAFRAFIRDELIPAVDGGYRTTGERAIIGESLAGLFVVETMLLQPALFDTYIAVDPSLWWNAGRLAGGAAEVAASGALAGRTVFLAASDDAETAASVAGLADALRAADDAPVVHHVPMPGEGHGTIFHPAALHAFRTVFAAVDSD